MFSVYFFTESKPGSWSKDWGHNAAWDCPTHFRKFGNFLEIFNNELSFYIRLYKYNVQLEFDINFQNDLKSVTILFTGLTRASWQKRWTNQKAEESTKGLRKEIKGFRRWVPTIQHIICFTHQFEDNPVNLSINL